MAAIAVLMRSRRSGCGVSVAGIGCPVDPDLGDAAPASHGHVIIRRFVRATLELRPIEQLLPWLLTLIPG
jgi:hypothetical protein